MPVTSHMYMDVDRVMCKADFWSCLSQNLKWPWTETHYVRLQTCFFCNTEAEQSPEHFVFKMTHTKLFGLLHYQNFWCKTCDYCLYDHFTPDKCDFCWSQRMQREVDTSCCKCWPTGQ